jgi:hypothetical protein
MKSFINIKKAILVVLSLVFFVAPGMATDHEKEIKKLELKIKKVKKQIDLSKVVLTLEPEKKDEIDKRNKDLKKKLKRLKLQKKKITTDEKIRNLEDKLKKISDNKQKKKINKKISKLNKELIEIEKKLKKIGLKEKKKIDEERYKLKEEGETLQKLNEKFKENEKNYKKIIASDNKKEIKKLEEFGIKFLERSLKFFDKNIELGVSEKVKKKIEKDIDRYLKKLHSHLKRYVAWLEKNKEFDKALKFFKNKLDNAYPIVIEGNRLRREKEKRDKGLLRSDQERDLAKGEVAYYEQIITFLKKSISSKKSKKAKEQLQISLKSNQDLLKESLERYISTIKKSMEENFEKYFDLQRRMWKKRVADKKKYDADYDELEIAEKKLLNLSK